MSTYYVVKNGQQLQETFGAIELEREVKAGHLDPNDLCWTAGMGQWSPIADVIHIPTPSKPPIASAEPTSPRSRSASWIVQIVTGILISVAVREILRSAGGMLLKALLGLILASVVTAPLWWIAAKLKPDPPAWLLPAVSLQIALGLIGAVMILVDPGTIGDLGENVALGGIAIWIFWRPARWKALIVAIVHTVEVVFIPLVWATGQLSALPLAGILLHGVATVAFYMLSRELAAAGRYGPYGPPPQGKHARQQ